MKDIDRNISVYNFKEWMSYASDEEIQELLDAGLEDIIYDLESDDFFGTEGLNKRLG